MDFLGLSLLGTFRGYSSLLSQMICLRGGSHGCREAYPSVFHRKPSATFTFCILSSASWYLPHILAPII